jgi:hypothetical protein
MDVNFWARFAYSAMFSATWRKPLEIIADFSVIFMRFSWLNFVGM